MVLVFVELISTLIFRPGRSKIPTVFRPGGTQALKGAQDLKDKDGF